jgi:hypothetical protein
MAMESGVDYLMTLISGNGMRAKPTGTGFTLGKMVIGTKASGICA